MRPILRCAMRWKRSLPGADRGLIDRFAGNRPAYRLALQTRESAYPPRRKAIFQHLHAQVLLAIIASMYAVYHGPEGLTHIARNRASPRGVAGGRRLLQTRIRATIGSIFRHPDGERGRLSRTRSSPARVGEQINLRIGEGTLGIAIDETTTPAIVEAVWRAFGGKFAYTEIEAVDRRGAARGTTSADPPSSPIRYFTPIARRPNFCATCAS